MKLTVNGETLSLENDTSVPALLSQIGAQPEHTALTINGTVIPAAERDRTRLQEGDVVEVITFVGGG